MRAGWLRLGVGLFFSFALAFGFWRLARSRTVQVFGRLAPRVETAERIVALTFDDGPTPERLEELLGPLESRGVRATFFVIGSHLAQNPETGRRLVAAGHELGNHTYSHERMILKSPAFVRSEVERTDALIRAAGYRGPIHFRPPFGYKLFALPWFLSRTGRTTVTWDLEPDSDAGASAEQIVTGVRERVRPGSIILLHVWYPSRGASRAAVPALVDTLRGDGYRFGTVSELLSLAPVAFSGSDP